MGEAMQQISPPLRIALVAVLLLAAVWFVALRPKGSPDEPAAPPVAAPGVAGLTSDVQKARNAKEAADAAAARAQQAAGGPAAPPATSARPAPTPSAAAAATPARPAATPRAAGPAAPLLRALDRGRVVVLVFRNRSADSAAVAAAARELDRRRRRVVVEIANVADVGRYRAFTGKTQVGQAPTTFVIGPSRRAHVITGFTTRPELSQAMSDMLVAARRAAARD